MEIHQLRYFLAVVSTRSFTAAAEACHVSQPSLSSQVAKLEEEVGGNCSNAAVRGPSSPHQQEEFFIPALSKRSGNWKKPNGNSPIWTG